MQEIRRQMRRRRRGLSPAERQQAADRLNRSLRGSSLYWRSRHLAVYLPNDGEMDLSAFIGQCLADGKRCYLPALDGRRLRFLRYTPDTPMVDNRFGIPEPDLSLAAARAPLGLDLVLAPLVAFDSHGNRLGMGGGFYDRSFAFRLQRRAWRRPALFGVAYSWQEVEQLSASPWDVPLDGIITERGVRRL